MRDHAAVRVVVDRVAIDAEELGRLVGGGSTGAVTAPSETRFSKANTNALNASNACRSSSSRERAVSFAFAGTTVSLFAALTTRTSAREGRPARPTNAPLRRVRPRAASRTAGRRRGRSR